MLLRPQQREQQERAIKAFFCSWETSLTQWNYFYLALCTETVVRWYQRSISLLRERAFYSPFIHKLYFRANKLNETVLRPLNSQDSHSMSLFYVLTISLRQEKKRFLCKDFTMLWLDSGGGASELKELRNDEKHDTVIERFGLFK